MFRISKAQINAGVPDMQRDFDARVTARMQRKYGDRDGVTPDRMARHVVATRQRAFDLGFVAEQHVFDLVEVSFLTRNAMWSDPFFERIINAPLMTREKKCVTLRRKYNA